MNTKDYRALAYTKYYIVTLTVTLMLELQVQLHHHHHQSGCFSLAKEEPLSTCFPQLPVFLNASFHKNFTSLAQAVPGPIQPSKRKESGLKHRYLISFFLNASPGRSYILDQVVAPSCSWSASSSFMSTGYSFCGSDCPSIVTSPCHVSRPSVFAFSYVLDNVLSHHSVFGFSLYSFCP